MSKKNKRVLIKISGEALAWETWDAFDVNILDDISDVIKDLQKEDIEIWIVIGWWNIFRWIVWDKFWLDKVGGHYMGMIATFINWLGLVEFFSNNKIKAKLMTSTQLDCVGERFDKKKAVKYLEDGKVVIFAGWTWNPFFTTDTAWVLRALEINADMIIKATKVDGLYDKDPKKFEDAKIFEKITYNEVLEKNLKVMDQAAIALARDNNLPLKIVNLLKKGWLKRAIIGEKEGTVVCN